jgi:hypothetical protein
LARRPRYRNTYYTDPTYWPSIEDARQADALFSFTMGGCLVWLFRVVVWAFIIGIVVKGLTGG